MSTEPQNRQERSGLGPGWWAAAALVAALLVGLVYVLIQGGRNNDSATSAPTATPPTSAGNAPTLTAPSTSAAPMTAAPSTPNVTSWNDRGCNAQVSASGDPLGQLAATAWTPFLTSAVPSSPTLGPTKVSGSIRQCYAHSPAGAIVAAANLSIMMNADDGQKVIETQWTPGPGRTKVAQDMAVSSHQPAAIAGYTLTGCSPSRCNVQLAATQGGQYITVLVAMVWQDGDWLVDGSVVPAESAVTTSFPAGFTQWGTSS